MSDTQDTVVVCTPADADAGPTCAHCGEPVGPGHGKKR